MTREERILSKMKSIPRDTESLVRTLCETLVEIEDIKRFHDKLDYEIGRIKDHFNL